MVINDKYEIFGNNEFHKFDGMQLKVANVIKITFDDNSFIRVSYDHKFKDKNARDLVIFDTLDGKTIINIEKDGADYVYDFIDVEGHIYEANNIQNHNCSFLGSSLTLISANKLENLKEVVPLECTKNYAFNIYEKPIAGVLYLIGVDVGAGTGNDYSVIQVLRVLDPKHFRQVAVYAENTLNPVRFAREIRDISVMYNNSMCMIENNGPGGGATINELWYNLEFSNLINPEPKELGINANRKTKLNACLNLKVVFDEDRIEIQDSKTISELSQFIEKTPGIFCADSGCHDDRVTSLYWACYAATLNEVDLTTNNMNANEKEDDVYRLDAFYEKERADDDAFWHTIS
jgi:hypothetical protein